MDFFPKKASYDYFYSFIGIIINYSISSLISEVGLLRVLHTIYSRTSEQIYGENEARAL